MAFPELYFCFFGVLFSLDQLAPAPSSNCLFLSLPGFSKFTTVILTEIHTYAENHEEYFKEVLGMEKMISRAELGRIMAALDGDTVRKVMVDLLR